MYFKLLSYLGRFRKQAILAPLAVIGEVALEIYIPFLMARIIDIGIAQKNVPYIVETGLLMIAAAVVSLACGAAGARLAAVAAAGFAMEIRKAVFGKIQDFSFSNTDRFSTASLITRLTTDITFVQNAFMMTIRALVRSPVMLVCATLMAVRINADLSTVFLVAIPFLGISLGVMSTLAHKHFLQMFAKYDAMNSSLQEVLIAARVVKAFVREKFEDKKFNAAAPDLRAAQKKAEKIVIFNMPLMKANSSKVLANKPRSAIACGIPPCAPLKGRYLINATSYVRCIIFKHGGNCLSHHQTDCRCPKMGQYQHCDDCRYRPVTLSGHAAIREGAPSHTTRPPASPPPGPMSMT